MAIVPTKRVLPADLPQEIQAAMAGLAKGQPVEGYRRIRLEGMALKGVTMLLGAALCAGFLALFRYHPQSVDWDSPINTPLAILMGLPALLGLLMVLRTGLALVNLIRRPWASCALVTPGWLVRFDRNGQAASIDRLADLGKLGLIEGRRVSYRRGDGWLRFKVRGNARAVALLKAIQATREGLEEKNAPADLDAWLEAHPGDRAPKAPGAGRALMGGLLRLVIVALIGVPLVGWVWSINLRMVDDSLWRKAQTPGGTEYDNQPRRILDYIGFAKRLAYLAPPMIADTTEHRVRLPKAFDMYDDARFEQARASKNGHWLRGYQSHFPKGRHLVEAKEALVQLYAEAAELYSQEAAGRGADPKAVGAITDLLVWAGKVQKPQIQVIFGPVEGLDGGKIEQVIQKQTGSERIHPVAPAFDEVRNRNRHHNIQNAVAGAFGQLYGGTLLQVVAKPKGEAATLRIDYRILPSGAAYSLKDEQHLPKKERAYFPGIIIGFVYTLTVPGAEQSVPLSTIVRPAPDFSVAAQQDGRLDPTAVFDRMAGTAFENFRSQIIRAFGLSGAIAPPDGVEDYQEREAFPDLFDY